MPISLVLSVTETVIMFITPIPPTRRDIAAIMATTEVMILRIELVVSSNPVPEDILTAFSPLSPVIFSITDLVLARTRFLLSESRYMVKELNISSTSKL